jgi:TonB family protein
MSFADVRNIRILLNPRLLRALFLRQCLHALIFCVVFAILSPFAAADERSMEFDIPAQALDQALNAFRSAARVHIFYETALTAGRQSRGVKGSLTPGRALQTLLGETGLLVRRTDVDAFAILPGRAERDRAQVPASHPDGGFVSALQNGVLDLLCRNSQTRPGRYKVALEFWIAPTGVIQHSALVASTGDVVLDTALLQALRGGSINTAPPAEMAQPFILTVAPRPPSETGDCAGSYQTTR